MANSRADLNTFFQKLKLSLPKVECEQSEGSFLCNLILPRAEKEGHVLEECSFTGQAKTKKAAISQAAQQGLEHLHNHPIFTSLQPSGSLWAVIKKFYNQGFWKDPEFEGYVILAQMTEYDHIPLQIFQLARPVQQWAKDRFPTARSPEKFFEETQAYVAKNPVDGEACDLFSVEGNSVILKPEYKGRDKDGRSPALEKFSETMEEGSSNSWTAVLIPADTSARIQEVQLEGSSHYLQSIANVGGGSLEDVIVWGRIGNSRNILMVEKKHSEAQKTNQNEAIVPPTKRHKSEHNPFDTSNSYTNGKSMIDDIEPIENFTQEDRQSLSSDLRIKMETFSKPPAGYSLYNEDAPNVRGSSMLGKQVHGDLVLSNCRLRANEQRLPVMIWGHFNLDQFWAWRGSQLPNTEYAFSTTYPLFAQLPTKYGSGQGYVGSTPINLLSSYMRDIRFNTNEQENNTDQHPHSQLPENTNPHETSMSSSVINAGQNKSEQGDLGITQRNSTHCSDRKRKLVENSRWECRISAQNLMKEGDSVPENYEACVSGCESEESAKQEAALKLLRLYEGAQMALFKEDFEAQDGELLSKLEFESEQEHSNGLTYKHEDGVILKFSFRITAIEAPLIDQVLSEGHGKCELGCGSLLPEIESILRSFFAGKSKTQELRLRVNGPNSYCNERMRCLVEITVDKRQFVQNATQLTENGEIVPKKEPLKLFEPSMATQRHEHICRVLEKEKLSTVLDIGCGSVKLVEFMLNQTLEGRLQGLRKIVGIDIDGQAVEKGLRKLLKNSELLADRQPGLELYAGDIACNASSQPGAWGQYTGSDFAIFQEVIEHLDPEPLCHLARSLLGSLQPKILVLSTPNFDYNQVLNCLDTQLLPNGLRNSDHRFEWTRKEFQEWCGNAANEYQYSVEFEGVGHAKDEAKALQNLMAEDFGTSTQVAIFRRMTTFKKDPPSDHDQVFQNILFDKRKWVEEQRREIQAG